MCLGYSGLVNWSGRRRVRQESSAGGREKLMVRVCQLKGVGMSPGSSGQPMG